MLAGRSPNWRAGVRDCGALAGGFLNRRRARKTDSPQCMAAAGVGGYSSQNSLSSKLQKINWFINVPEATHVRNEFGN